MRNKGFTLIELLVVVAIILILIAIALPNFLEAQIRARVTKARGELRTLGQALELYRTDWKIYPPRSVQYYKNQPPEQVGLTWLLAPIAYVTSLPDDPFPTGVDFHTGLEGSGPAGYMLTGVDSGFEFSLAHPHNGVFLRTWLLFSAGPDAPTVEVDPEKGCMAINQNSLYYGYSPTNGTRSRGDLWRFGGEREWMGVDITRTSRGGCTGLRAQDKTLPKVGVFYNAVRLVQTFPAGDAAN